MEIANHTVRADRHTDAVVECAIGDHLVKNLSVPVVFFYEKPVDPALLMERLGQVLGDFPIFAGRLKHTGGSLRIDCNNRGVAFSVLERDCTLAEAIDRIKDREKNRIVASVRPGAALSGREPVFTVRVSRYACGGTAIGLSWHHSIGDMRTFMCLMSAWSRQTRGEPYEKPPRVATRAAYLDAHILHPGSPIPAVRYLSLGEIGKYACYFLFQARKLDYLLFYFTPDEIGRMRAELGDQCNASLSANDALSAHLFCLIAERDATIRSRYLSIAVDYRSRVGLPATLLGNCITAITLPCEPGIGPAPLALGIRQAVDRFETDHMNYHATARAIESRGGARKIGRFIPKAIDPISGSLLVTNWSRFGVYDIDFGAGPPLYFAPVGDFPFPWLSAIMEGFSNRGALFGAALPTGIAARLGGADGLRQVHRYRDPAEALPEFVRRLSWVR